MFITQTREIELCLNHDLGSLRGGLFLKDTVYPQPVAAFSYNKLEIEVDGELCCSARKLLWCVFGANAFESTFVLVSNLLVSSVLDLVAVFFIKSCDSACFNQSLKSRRVGFA